MGCWSICLWPFPLVNISRSSQHFPFKRCNTPGLAVFSAFFFVSIPIFVAKIHLGSSESRVPTQNPLVYHNGPYELAIWVVSIIVRHIQTSYHHISYIYISPFYHHYIGNISIISPCYHTEFRLNPPLFSPFLLLETKTRHSRWAPSSAHRTGRASRPQRAESLRRAPSDAPRGS